MWSSDYTTFSEPDHWVTIVGTSSSTPDSAIAWCVNRGLDRDHCFAKRISVGTHYDKTTQYQ